MPKHPFEPLIFQETKKIIIGTLPPETATFYFSNSSNTRLWDMLRTIREQRMGIYSGSNNLTAAEKIEILRDLNLGIADIILEYERDIPNSTRDVDIDPKKYRSLIEIVRSNIEITHLLFVYESAYKWFLHSLNKEIPVRISSLSGRFSIGIQNEIQVNEDTIQCIILPSPLNRGRRGETLK